MRYCHILSVIAITLLILFIGLTTAIPWWLGQVLASFTPLAWLLSITLLCISLMCRQARNIKGCALVISLILSILCLRPLLLTPSQTGQPAANATPITVLGYNMWYQNKNNAAIIAALNAAQPAIMVIPEITDSLIADMAKTLRDQYYTYPTIDDAGNFENPYGLAVWSQYPITAVHTIPIPEQKRVFVDVVIQIAHVPLHVIAVHFQSPKSAHNHAERTAQIATVLNYADILRAQGKAVLLIGDFNITPWSRAYRGIVHKNQWYSAIRRIPDFEGSWPAWLPWLLRLPIDHAFASHNLRLEKDRVWSNALGSDHHPVSYHLWLP